MSRSGKRNRSNRHQNSIRESIGSTDLRKIKIKDQFQKIRNIFFIIGYLISKTVVKLENFIKNLRPLWRIGAIAIPIVIPVFFYLTRNIFIPTIPSLIANYITAIVSNNKKENIEVPRTKKITDEQRKNTEEYRAKIAENSGITVAIAYKLVANIHRNIALALSRDGFVYMFTPRQDFINIPPTLFGKKDIMPGSYAIIGPSLIPMIIYYDSKFESKAREVQRLIKPLVSIDSVGLASTTYSSSPGVSYSPGLSWQIEISLPDSF